MQHMSIKEVSGRVNQGGERLECSEEALDQPFARLACIYLQGYKQTCASLESYEVELEISY